MGLSSNLSGINFSGIGSGIDTNGIITRLLALEAIPIQRLQQQKAQLEQRQGIYSSLKGQLQNLASKAGALNNSTAFTVVSATTSDDKVATVTASEGAAAGTYSLDVTKLAQFQKVGTTTFSDTTSAIGATGEVVINGKTVNIAASDSLSSIAQKINGLSVGVTASVINGGSGNSFLSLTSSKSGASNKIQIADVNGGNAAQTLGLVNGTPSIANAITNGFATRTFDATTTVFGTLLGNSDRPAGTFTINGATINVDYTADSIQTIAGKINASGSGASATVETVKVDGVDKYRLRITGSGSTPTYTDPNGIMGELGILQNGYSNQLVAAQDAEYKLDNVSFTSATNNITGVVTGVSFTLLKASSTAVLTLSQDDTAVKNKIKDFMNAYNGVVDFIKSQTAFDKDTFATGALFGDNTVQNVEGALSNQLFATLDGLQSQYKNLTQLGFSFSEDAKLELNESQLDTALATNSAAVGNLFRATGVSANEQITFVSATAKARASAPAGYGVNITQAATKTFARFSMGGAATTITDKLTFNGTLLSSTPYELNVPIGATVDSLVSQINTDAKLKDLVVASNVGGELRIESKKFGTPGDFTVSSSITGDPGSDVVLERQELSAGVNVAGTINGEAATGSGQFLTGNAGNEKTDGLQLMYSGTATGMIGNLTYNVGVAANINNMINSFNDSVNGLLTGNDKAIADQISSIDQSVESFQERIKIRELTLRQKFLAMEEAIATLQQQGNQLGSLAPLRS